MPNISTMSKHDCVKYLHRKSLVLVTLDGHVVTPENLEESNIDNVTINLEA